MKACLVMGLLLFWAIPARAETPTQLASAMVGSPVTVHCIAMRGMYGYTEQTDSGTAHNFAPEIWLSRGTCEGLHGLSDGKIYNVKSESNSLATILHESMHIRLNSGNEAKVECTAMENLWNWIVPFGFSARVNSRLYRSAWMQHYELGPQYLGNCHPARGILPRDMGPVNPQPMRKHA